jgi:hypothetical protein
VAVANPSGFVILSSALAPRVLSLIQVIRSLTSGVMEFQASSITVRRAYSRVNATSDVAGQGAFWGMPFIDRTLANRLDICSGVIVFAFQVFQRLGITASFSA